MYILTLPFSAPVFRQVSVLDKRSTNTQSPGKQRPFEIPHALFGSHVQDKNDSRCEWYSLRDHDGTNVPSQEEMTASGSNRSKMTA
jgi:hypothetical protein